MIFYKEKKWIGRIWLIVGFLGALFGGWLSNPFTLNPYPQWLIWSYWIIYAGHLISWKLLFDYKTGGIDAIQKKHR